VHIPDGFLDLRICVIMYLLAVVFWFFSFRKARGLSEKQIPLMASLTAMFFAAQMMNYPIVGGTTAHLLGGPILAVTVGPYLGLISMTIILLIQALFFGDGGITTFGANVWNMGIVGTFVPFIIYQLAQHVTRTQRGKLVGVFVGALVGDVLAALCAGLELGVSTAFPYGVAIAVAAMVAHHVIIGIGEGVITVGMILVLQKARPDLLQLPKLAPSWLGGV
jgi:cobalt/nickel transport system permease protein